MKSHRTRLAWLFLLATTLAFPALAQNGGSTQAASYGHTGTTFTLRTGVAEGKLVFIGASAGIQGQVNPNLVVPQGATVQITVINGEGTVHDIVIPEFGAASPHVSRAGASTSVSFVAGKLGEFAYFCSLPGHRAAGMEGLLVVVSPKELGEMQKSKISRSPMEVGQPVGDRAPQHLTVNMETTEIDGQLSNGTTYRYWTFDNQVPGPFIRIRVGDSVTVNLHNAKESQMMHSIDLHAVTGPGGGADVTQVAPGQTKSFTFKALHPGLFVYHCATPLVAAHIANGMYGLILVEPAGGLPKVDREFYVMQGEMYTDSKFEAHKGIMEFSYEKMMDEEPEYYVFNGAVGSLTKTHQMQAKVGESVRIFFGVGGPNKTSSFHVIGEVFDRAYPFASYPGPFLTNVQTVSVPPGGATVVEFKTEVPGHYVLVDHALSRAERGLVGILNVVGPENRDVFRAEAAPQASAAESEESKAVHARMHMQH